MKRKHWIVLLTMIAAAFLLSACGVNRNGVDIMHTPPQGWWQILIVWPMGKSLIWMDDIMRQVNIPYHWGFAIILFTIAIKVITFPLTITQIKGMQAQKELQPKIQELQKKYGKDREKISQEQMKLYQEAGVNPLSGCLPLIIQMPILFGLYSALVALGPSLSNASFFWIPDLGYPKYSQGMSWISEAFQQGKYGFLAAYLILPVLLMVSQFIMQKWMTPTTPDAEGQAAGMTKQIGLMMTFMFGFFTLQVPSGLTLYWVTSNLLQMLQQWVITTDRFGMSTSNVTTVKAGVEKNQKQITNGATPATASVNGAQAEVNSDKPKETKRRRAKRR